MACLVIEQQGCCAASQTRAHHAPRPLPSPPSAFAARAAGTGAQLETQLPGALLEVGSSSSGGGDGGGRRASPFSIRINGYASSAALLRSNVVFCRTVLHVVDAVLLVS